LKLIKLFFYYQESNEKVPLHCKWITDKQRAENIYNPSKIQDLIENNLPSLIYITT